MNRSQSLILVVFLPLTLLILAVQILYPDQDPVYFIRYLVRIFMLAWVFRLALQHRGKWLLFLAFLSTVISDYYFVLMRASDPGMQNRELYGIVGFLAAYLFLIAAFQRNFHIGKKELLASIPFIGVFTAVFILLEPYATGFLYPAASTMGVVLCYTGMTMVSTLFRHHFSRRIAWFAACAIAILFLSDMMVAFSIFHPDFQGFLVWKETFIWGTYMPGWILLMLEAAE